MFTICVLLVQLKFYNMYNSLSINHRNKVFTNYNFPNQMVINGWQWQGSVVLAYESAHHASHLGPLGKVSQLSINPSDKVLLRNRNHPVAAATAAVE